MPTMVGGMTISLDGFFAAEKGNSGELYPDLVQLRGSDYMNEMVASAGAVLMGRHTFEMAADPDFYADNYEYQLPIFVLTSSPPARQPRETDRLTFTFVTTGSTPRCGRRATAGDKTVQVVGGPRLTSGLLVAGLLDELRVDVMPVFLGAGRRLFDDQALQDIAPRRTGVIEVGQRTSPSFASTDDLVLARAQRAARASCRPRAASRSARSFSG
jgi:dihydrofolate reductase